MTYYKNYNFETLKRKKYKVTKTLDGEKKETIYSDNIYTFDTETSNLFQDVEGVFGWIGPDKNGPADEDNFAEQRERYKNATKLACLYLWQFCVNGEAVYGRTLDELADFFNLLEEHDPDLKIVYVHNLSFEFQWLRNIDKTFEVFARAPRKVMKANSAVWKIEWRCSLYLTNMKLEKLPKHYGTPTKKLVEVMDYDKVRTPDTILDEDTLRYAENDVIVLYEAISKEVEVYKHVVKIPLTASSKVRKQLKKLFQKDMARYRQVDSASPRTAEEFKLLLDAYAGGYTHANVFHTDQVIPAVDHVDFASSYPAVLFYEKYPTTRFRKVSECLEYYKRADRDFHAYILDFTATDIHCKTENTFISASKCLNLKNPNLDNGRIIDADEMRLVCCDVDMDIFLKSYKMKVESITVYRACKSYLPKKFLLFLLDLYKKKTSLKGVDDAEYNAAKVAVNTLYGITVTNLITPELLFDESAEKDEDLWKYAKESKEEMRERVEQQLQYHYHEPTKCRSVFPYSVGVFVAAYARANLLNTVIEMDEDVCYCDTDSIFYKPTERAQRAIENCNKKILEKIATVCYTFSIDAAETAPADKEGKTYQLGIFTREDDCGASFTTMGAKKYCVEKDGVRKLTLAGVNKVEGVKRVLSLDDFEDGLFFDERFSGKLVAYYNEHQQPFDVTDYQGHTTHIDTRKSICLMKTTYTLHESGSVEERIQQLLEIADHHININFDI